MVSDPQSVEVIREKSVILNHPIRQPLFSVQQDQVSTFTEKVYQNPTEKIKECQNIDKVKDQSIKNEELL